MDRWTNVVVNVEGSQLVLTPSLNGLQTNLLDSGLRNVLALLDELGLRGWEVTAVREDEYWLKKPIPEGHSRAW
jgi:hypothetical protein